MDVQPSVQSLSEKDVIQRQAVSQLLRARLRATAGITISDVPMATPNPAGLSPLQLLATPNSDQSSPT